MAEGRIHHDGDAGFGVLVHQGANRFIELGEARRGSAFGGDVGSVNDDALIGHVSRQSITCFVLPCGWSADLPTLRG
jgi:hypothetical protein